MSYTIVKIKYNINAKKKSFSSISSTCCVNLQIKWNICWSFTQPLMEGSHKYFCLEQYIWQQKLLCHSETDGGACSQRACRGCSVYGRAATWRVNCPCLKFLFVQTISRTLGEHDRSLQSRRLYLFMLIAILEIMVVNITQNT